MWGSLLLCVLHVFCSTDICPCKAACVKTLPAPCSACDVWVHLCINVCVAKTSPWVITLNLAPTKAMRVFMQTLPEVTRDDPLGTHQKAIEGRAETCVCVCLCKQRVEVSVHMLGCRKAPGSVSPAACPLAREQPQQMNNSSSAVVLQARPR